MPTDIAPFNPFRENQSQATSFVRWKSFRITLADTNRQILFLPYENQARTKTITFDNNGTGMIVEVTATGNDIINADIENVTTNAVWKTITTTQLITISHPVVALRFENASGAPRIIDVLV